MNKIFLTIAVSLLWAQGTFSQVNEDPDFILPRFKGDTIEEIKKIESEVLEIQDNIKYYKLFKETKDSLIFKSVYKTNNEIRIIIVNYKNVIDNTLKYYFHNEQLIYCEGTWTDMASKKLLNIEKYYLYYDNLIGWTKSGKSINSNSEEFKKAAVKVRSYALKLKDESLN